MTENNSEIDHREQTTRFVVPDEDGGTRADKWLAGHDHGLTRSRLQSLMREGKIMRNDVPALDPSTKLNAGDVIVITLPEITTLGVAPEPMKLDIPYEDAHLIVINKPSGLVVHPGAGNENGTLVNALMAHCGDSLSGIGGVARPGIVHRIDKDTSGLIVVAKHDEAHLGLSKLFAEHDIDRVYHALIVGALRPGVGTVETLIGRNRNDRRKMAVIAETETRPDARVAITHYKTLARYGSGRAKLAGDAVAALIECRLETGRTHQIRVHMTHLGAPLIGDPVYGRGPGLAGLKPVDDVARTALNKMKSYRGQALHAHTLGFVHPITGEKLHFQAPLPKDFEKLRSALAAL